MQLMHLSQEGVVPLKTRLGNVQTEKRDPAAVTEIVFDHCSNILYPLFFSGLLMPQFGHLY